jgi:DNA-binding NarL/FixJ family response regulator
MTRVLLADDHKIFSHTLRVSLEQQTELQVVAEASDGREAVQLVKELNPDVAVMDIRMPGLNGIEATSQITKESSSCRVLALSMLDEKQFVINMMKAGAMGYLSKSATLEELVTAILTVADGKFYVSNRIAGYFIEEAVNPQMNTNGLAKLTDREQEIVRLVAEGMTSQEIADELNVGKRTVESYRYQLMDKLKIRSVAELTKFAIRQGLTGID